MQRSGYGFTITNDHTKPMVAGRHYWLLNLYFWGQLKKGGLPPLLSRYFLTPTVEGKRNDKKLADESVYQLPKGSYLLQDTGFQGFELESFLILQQKKKPRGSELTEEEKTVK